MDNKPVLFIDSGIGGLPYCLDFLKKNQNEEVCYLADTKNFPYGPRKKKELVFILKSLTATLLDTINPKIIVLACNTATLSALDALRRHFPQVQFVGTVPALKPAAKISNNGKVGVLGTERTVKEIRNFNLVDGACEIFGIAAPELVEFVENRFDKANEKEKRAIVKKYIDLFRSEEVDSLVLGCTHFLFLHDEFHIEAAPDIEVFDSLAGITKRIEFLLDENSGNLRADNNNQPLHKLLLTEYNPMDTFWQKRAKKMKFKLSLIDKP